MKTQQLEAKQARLEKLSRALQAERNELAQRLRQYEDKTKEGTKKKKNVEEKNKEGNKKDNGRRNETNCVLNVFVLFSPTTVYVYNVEHAAHNSNFIKQ